MPQFILKPSLTDINGILHVKSPIIFQSKPELINNYWSTGINTNEFTKLYGPIDKIEISETRSFSGRFCFKRHYLDPYTYIDLINGAKTESTKTDVIPIPCPKVRTGIETRWHDGRWQKYLKSKGWVNF